MANVMSLKKVRNKPSRNGFDLSNKNCFTAQVGELLPVMVKEVLPGDKFKINAQWFTRTQPVNSAAYTRLREYYDFFFVPNRLLWRFFPNAVMQMQNLQSAVSVTRMPNNGSFGTYLPRVTLSVLEELANDSGSLDIFGHTNSYGRRKLLRYLNYPIDFSSQGDNTLVVNPLPLLAYQKIWYDYYRNPQWQLSDPTVFNVDYVNGNDVSSSYLDNSFKSLASQSPLDNFMTLRYCNWQKDLFMGVMPSPQYGDVASVNVVGTEADTSITTGLPSSGISVATFNRDVRIQSASTLNDKNYNVEVYGLGDPNLKINGSNDDDTDLWRLVSAQVPRSAASNDHTHQVKLKLDTLASQFDILALRRAEALQRWKEVTEASNYDYRSQVSSHFGASPSRALSGLCEFIGGTSSDLNFGEVINTNLSDNKEGSAYIQGKGVSSGKGSISFEAQEHGIIMCVYHALPLLDYLYGGAPRLNVKVNPTDYALPEFDKVGMEELGGYTLLGPGYEKSIIGYVPRYVEYKTAVDEIHGEFSGSMSHWVAPITYQYLLSFVEDNQLKVDYKFFKVNPSILDPIFAVTAFNADNSHNSDQLLINSYFDVKVVRNLDYDGLPY